MYIRLFPRVVCIAGKWTRVGYQWSEDWIMSRFRQSQIETILSYVRWCFIVKVRLSSVTVKHRGDLAVHGGETMEYEGRVGLYTTTGLGRFMGRLTFTINRLIQQIVALSAGSWELGYGCRKSPSSLRNVKFWVNSAACSHEPPRGWFDWLLLYFDAILLFYLFILACESRNKDLYILMIKFSACDSFV